MLPIQTCNVVTTPHTYLPEARTPLIFTGPQLPSSVPKIHHFFLSVSNLTSSFLKSSNKPLLYLPPAVECSWNVMTHGDAREEKWRGNWRMEWVASTLHTTSEHGVSNITTADAHTSTASRRMKWRPNRFKWVRPFRRKTKNGFFACAITFQTQSNTKKCCIFFSYSVFIYSILFSQQIAIISPNTINGLVVLKTSKFIISSTHSFF